MARIFGFDIGTTSIGFAVIDHDPVAEVGSILRLGVRIFPEARDPDGTPLNQQRRQKRMVRRQIRRRRTRRRLVNETLRDYGLLPRFNTPEWLAAMAVEPYGLRKRGISEALQPYEVGRALYHLAQQRHFKGRDLEETEENEEEAADEKAAKTERESTLRALKKENVTLGTWLADRDPNTRKRGVHAHRDVVKDEFDKLWAAQAVFHPSLRNDAFREQVEDAIFAQRPVFWRKSTLGSCRFMPGEALCPKGSWLSHQRRMLEKLNNLALATGNGRPLDPEERAVILAQLQTQGSMSWGKVRTALKPLYKQRGEDGGETKLKLNLEVGGDPTLLGNAIEAKLSGIFGEEWVRHPHQQTIRDSVPQRLWSADYGEIGDQRVVILSSSQRKANRDAAARGFIDEFGVTPDQAQKLRDMNFPSGWEPYSTRALHAFMPHLEAGKKFGALINGPDWEEWRKTTFPDREQPTGEFLDRLPSPANKEESERIAKLRNPTVVRAQNELRKVVNNLIDMFGKPDLIRVELARDVGKSKREREEIKSAIRKHEARRKAAVKDLESNGIIEPSHRDIEKWLLWKEGSDRCPYSGDQIGFDALFREGRYEVEHIWPRSRSLDDSFRNKTLCRKDINAAKGNKTPFEYYQNDPEKWADIQRRMRDMIAPRGGIGMSPGKVKRFLADKMPDDFASRQLNDTGYAARQAIAMLRRLWPDVGVEAPVTVQAVTGRVTAQLRKLWGLNNILSDDGEKTRADHRHHAVDALTVACAHPGMTNKLSRYWEDKDNIHALKPQLPPPWADIRADAERAVEVIVVSHRVRKKVSGPLHKETTYGDTGTDVTTKTGTYRQFVTRKRIEVLTKSELADIRDEEVRKIVSDAATARGGEPKKAFPPYPKVCEGGPEIRKVRLLSKQQLSLMAPVSTGYADLGSNHHIAIYRSPDGKIDFQVVSLFEAARRLAKREPVVRKTFGNCGAFVMSLSPGDAVELMEGKKKGRWIVTGFWSNGQIVLENTNDATHATTTRPNPESLLKANARKISIDPIGRVRVAND
jgi:CRISPR-associated endonuclease Csn1